MKINTTKENLLHGVQMVQRAVSPKNPLPVLAGILFEAKDNTLTLTATDLEIGIECTVPVTTISPGSVVIPARYISDIVRKLPDVPIDISVDATNNTVVVNYSTSEVRLHSLNAEEFPAFPSVENDVTIELANTRLKEMLRQVLFATSNDENRPVFTGVLFEIKENVLSLVTTDTHRLALRKLNLTTPTQDAKVIIPGRTLSELVRIMPNQEDNVKIILGNNQALFSTADTVLVSRLIEGQFPAYDQVIPQDYNAKLRVKVQEMLESTERAALLTTSGKQTVKLSTQQDLIFITANTEIGGIHEEVNAYLEGEPMEIAFNATYLTDVLKAVGKEEAYFELNGPLNPGVIKPVDDDNYITLILPVRTA